MMYLPLIGKVEQLLAESDQQNLGNDDTCKKNMPPFLSLFVCVYIHRPGAGRAMGLPSIH